VTDVLNKAEKTTKQALITRTFSLSMSRLELRWRFAVGVLLDLEILLNRSLGVRKEGPLGSD
jgi:hypothetical protein